MNTETTIDVPSELKPQVINGKANLRPRKKKNKAKILYLSLETLEQIIMDCVTWGEAKPYVDLLEKAFGINAPQEVRNIIKKARNRFNKMVYGPKSIKYGDTIQGDKNTFQRGSNMNRYQEPMGINSKAIVKRINCSRNGKRQSKG